MPMAFMYAAESREFFYSIALVRLMQEAARMFNNEEIFVEGFAPLPHQPAAWTGKAPDLSSFVAELRKKMKVTTIDDAGNLLIPQATDIPFAITPQLQAELQKLALQFPRPIKNQIKDITPPVEEKPQCTMLKSMDELKNKFTILGKCAQPTFEIIVVTESKELPVDGALDEGQMVWLHNPAESKPTCIEPGGYVFGLDYCGVIKATDSDFDPSSPCSVLWSFARPGKHEKVSAETASLWTVLTGKTELQLVTVADALASTGKAADGNIWGFLKLVDGKKNACFKPMEPLYVIPKHVAPSDIKVDNAGFFIGMRAAMEPDKSWEWIVPKLVVYAGGSKATFEPKVNSSMVRFVAAKKISIPSKHCVRMY